MHDRRATSGRTRCRTLAQERGRVARLRGGRACDCASVAAGAHGRSRCALGRPCGSSAGQRRPLCRMEGPAGGSRGRITGQHGHGARTWHAVDRRLLLRDRSGPCSPRTGARRTCRGRRHASRSRMDGDAQCPGSGPRRRCAVMAFRCTACAHRSIAPRRGHWRSPTRVGCAGARPRDACRTLHAPCGCHDQARAGHGCASGCPTDGERARRDLAPWIPDPSCALHRRPRCPRPRDGQRARGGARQGSCRHARGDPRGSSSRGDAAPRDCGCTDVGLRSRRSRMAVRARLESHHRGARPGA